MRLEGVSTDEVSACGEDVWQKASESGESRYSMRSNVASSAVVLVVCEVMRRLIGVRVCGGERTVERWSGAQEFVPVGRRATR